MSTITSVVQKQANSMAIATKPKALEVMAARVNVEPAKLMATLQCTCFKGASNEEMLALVVVANEYGLNPFLKEIYAFPKKGGGIVPMIPIDGWAKIINRQEDYDGVEFEWEWDEERKPIACTCVLHVKGRAHAIKVTEYFEECFRETEPWRNMPRRMLRHKAFMQAGRIAFGLAGVHDEDEAIDISATIEESPRNPFDGLKKPNFEQPKQIENTEEAEESAAGLAPSTPPASTKNFLKGVRGLMGLAKITEADLLDYLRASGKINDTVSSLEEMNMVAIVTLEWTFDNWQAVEKAVKAATKGASAK